MPCVCVCAVLTVGPSLMPPKLPHSDFYTHKRNASFPSTDRWHLNRCLNLTRARSLPVPVFLLLRVTKQQATLALDCGFWSDSLNTKCLWRSGRCLPQCPVHCILFAGARLCNLDLSPRPRLQDHTFQCFVWPDLTLHSPCLPSPSTRLIILDTWHAGGTWPDSAQTQIQECRGECGQETEQTEYSHNFLSLFRLFSIWSHSALTRDSPAATSPCPLESPVARWRSLTKFESDNQFSCQNPPSTGDMRAWEHTGTCPDWIRVSCVVYRVCRA